MGATMTLKTGDQPWHDQGTTPLGRAPPLKWCDGDRSQAPGKKEELILWL